MRHGVHVLTAPICGCPDPLIFSGTNASTAARKPLVPSASATTIISPQLARRPTRPCEPLFEVVPLLPGFLFRSRLMIVIIPMLPAHVGLMARIKALSFRPIRVASRRRVDSPMCCVGSLRATLVFPSGNGAAILVVVVIFHLVVPMNYSLSGIPDLSVRVPVPRRCDLR
jgi:hypothetical protein